MPNLIMRASGEASNAGGMVAGSYFGNGQANQVINLGFTPVAVFVAISLNPSGDATAGSLANSYLATTDVAAKWGGNTQLEIVANGFRVVIGNGNYFQNTNVNGARYNYIAFK